MAIRKLIAVVTGALREIAAADAVQLPAAAGFAAEYDAGDTGTAITLDFANGQKQRCRLTGNAVVTMGSAPLVGHYQARVQQDGTGGRTLTIAGLASDPWLMSATQPDHNMAIDGWSVWNGYWDGSAWSMCSLMKVGAA